MGRATNSDVIDAVAEADLLYDERVAEHYELISVRPDGVTLRRRDHEYYIPHSVFAAWYDPAHVTHDEAIDVPRPAWVGTDG